VRPHHGRGLHPLGQALRWHRWWWMCAVCGAPWGRPCGAVCHTHPVAHPFRASAASASASASAFRIQKPWMHTTNSRWKAAGHGHVASRCAMHPNRHCWKLLALTSDNTTVVPPTRTLTPASSILCRQLASICCSTSISWSNKYSTSSSSSCAQLCVCRGGVLGECGICLAAREAAQGRWPHLTLGRR